MKNTFLVSLITLILLLNGCRGGLDTSTISNEEEKMKINVNINGSDFLASIENNEATNELTKMMEIEPITLHLQDYGGFEKVGPLGRNLPSSDRHINTSCGDIVLYQSNQIVIFYGTNSWSYTPIGKIDDLTNFIQVMGEEDVVVIFSLLND